jgi:hypothetical protein
MNLNLNFLMNLTYLKSQTNLTYLKSQTNLTFHLNLLNLKTPNYLKSQMFR